MATSVLVLRMREEEKSNGRSTAGIGRVDEGPCRDLRKSCCVSFPNRRGVHTRSGVSLQRDWLTYLQRYPGHAKGTIYNTPILNVLSLIQLVNPKFLVSKSCPTLVHAIP